MILFENKKHVFWQAFFLTVLFFLIGLVLGVYLEQTRADEINFLFYQSEISLYDSFAFGNFLDSQDVSCADLKQASVDFADKIYNEARTLEKFDDSNKLTESVKLIHGKYDLLRTLLWMNLIKIREKCGEVNSAVYLYYYDSEDILIKPKQTAWSRVLGDLKDERGSDVILIPIAIDQGVVTLDYLVKEYGVERFPAVVINEENVLYELKTTEEIDQFFN